MEDQILALTAELAAVKSAAQVTNTMFAEAYYYLTIPLMVLIHAGFLLYEMGQTRVANVLSSGIKNLLAFAFTIVTFYLFGWWFYWALPTFPVTSLVSGAGFMGTSGLEYASAIALPWGESAQYMGPNMGDHAFRCILGCFCFICCNDCVYCFWRANRENTNCRLGNLCDCPWFFCLGCSCCLGLACRWLVSNRVRFS